MIITRIGLGIIYVEIGHTYTVEIVYFLNNLCTNVCGSLWHVTRIILLCVECHIISTCW